MNTLSFVLIFSDAVAEDLCSYSKLVGAETESKFNLDGNFVPHITVLQFEAEESEAESIWKELVNSEAPVTLEVIMAGLCFLPSPDNTEVWLEVPALKSDMLLELQRSLLLLPNLSGRRILNGCNDVFRPHVTLGLTSAIPDHGRIPMLPGDLLRRTVSCDLVLATNGPHYSVSSIVAR